MLKIKSFGSLALLAGLLLIVGLGPWQAQATVDGASDGSSAAQATTANGASAFAKATADGLAPAAVDAREFLKAKKVNVTAKDATIEDVLKAVKGSSEDTLRALRGAKLPATPQPKDSLPGIGFAVYHPELSPKKSLEAKDERATLFLRRLAREFGYDLHYRGNILEFRPANGSIATIPVSADNPPFQLHLIEVNQVNFDLAAVGTVSSPQELIDKLKLQDSRQVAAPIFSSPVITVGQSFFYMTPDEAYMRFTPTGWTAQGLQGELEHKTPKIEWVPSEVYPGIPPDIIRKTATRGHNPGRRITVPVGEPLLLGQDIGAGVATVAGYGHLAREYLNEDTPEAWMAGAQKLMQDHPGVAYWIPRHIRRMLVLTLA